jgi:acyl-CoA dehydrogenase
MITFALSEDQEMVRETVHRLAADEIRPRLRSLEKGGDASDLEQKVAALGVSLVDVPEELGGGGMGCLTAALVHEELAWGDPGAAVALFRPHLVPAALVELASADQARMLLSPVPRGAVAWTGQVTATADGVLDGKKEFVINAGIADVTIVFAGEAAFVVRGDNPGMRAGRRSEWIGLEAVRAGELVFEKCRADARLDRVDPAGMRRFFARAGLVTAARQVGLARAAYETALAYTQDRRAFGKAIAHFQSVAFTLADMHMDVESARWMVWRAAWELDTGAATALESIAKAAVHANEAAWRVADHAVQLHGGAGYIQDFPVEKWLRDTKALALIGGADQLAQLTIASSILGHEIGSPLPDHILQPVVT